MSGALRFNSGKPELHRLRQFGSANAKLAMVMKMGAIKYDDGNWLLGGKPDGEYLDSLDRHLTAFQAGEMWDPDTGCFHPSMAAWNALALARLNYDQLPDRDPAFDEAAFVARWRPDRASGLLTLDGS